MNKKIFKLAILASSVLPLAMTRNSGISSIFADEILMDIDSIQALTHKDGSIVNFINDDMIKMWATDVTDFEKMKEIYEYNTEIGGFADSLGNPDTIRLLYETYDDFKPVNNVLRWKTKLDARTFDIVVSLNDELTQVVYSETGLKKLEYKMENPLRNQHYYWQVTAHTRAGEKIKSNVFDFISGDYSRTIDVGGVSNTRDIGGVTTKYGTFQQGLVYRSARLDDIDQNGKNTLNKLHVKTDLDIRNEGEGAKNPANLSNYYLRTIQPYFQALNDNKRTETIECMRIFTDQNNYPLDYHCSVGRDRTGTLTILLLGLFGASEDYIYHEYYNSNYAVSSAYVKDLDDLNYNTVHDTIETLKNFGGSSLTESIENYLAPKADTVTGEVVGLSKEEINKIRDIFAGKIDVPNKVTTSIAEENYEGKCFVTFKSVGKKDVVKCINKNSTVTIPYSLSNDKAWYINGKIWNQNETVKESSIIYADDKSDFKITLHFIGLNDNDLILRLSEGSEIQMSNYEKNGYRLTAISDEGKQISRLVVSRDTVINLFYKK